MANAISTVGPGVRLLAEAWWVPVVRGVVAILFGALCLFAPGLTLMLLVAFWAAYAIIDGGFSLVNALRWAKAGGRWGWLLFNGVVGIAAGVVAFVWPGITAMLLLMVIAVWALFTGGAEIATAFALRKHIKNEWLMGIAGALSILFGVLLIANPGAGALAVVWIIGAYAMIFGVLLVGLGMRLNSFRKTQVPTVPRGRAPTPA